MYTIDASVLVNASDPRETGHKISKQFLEYIQMQSIVIVEPTLVIAEVAAAIGRSRGDARLAKNLAQRLSQLSNTRFVDLDLHVALKTAHIAAEHRLRAADAIYIAVAVDAETTLVTLDQEQKQRASTIVRVCSPSDVLDNAATSEG